MQSREFDSRQNCFFPFFFSISCGDFLFLSSEKKETHKKVKSKVGMIVAKPSSSALQVFRYSIGN